MAGLRLEGNLVYSFIMKIIQVHTQKNNNKNYDAYRESITKSTSAPHNVWF